MSLDLRFFEQFDFIIILLHLFPNKLYLFLQDLSQGLLFLFIHFFTIVFTLSLATTLTTFKQLAAVHETFLIVSQAHDLVAQPGQLQIVEALTNV